MRKSLREMTRAKMATERIQKLTHTRGQALLVTQLLDCCLHPKVESSNILKMIFVLSFSVQASFCCDIDEAVGKLRG